MGQSISRTRLELQQQNQRTQVQQTLIVDPQLRTPMLSLLASATLGFSSLPEGVYSTDAICVCGTTTRVGNIVVELRTCAPLAPRARIAVCESPCCPKAAPAVAVPPSAP